MREIKLYRVTNPAGLKFLEPVLLDVDPSVRKEDFLESLEHLMMTTPDYAYVIQLWDVTETEDEAEPQIVGYMITTTNDYSSCAFVHQAWAEPRLQREMASLIKESLFKTITWAQSLGKESLRCETNRVPGAFERKFKFKPVAQTLELNFFDLIGQLFGKDDLDGQQQSRHEVEFDERPEALSSEDGEHFEPEAGGPTESFDSGSEISGSIGQSNSRSDSESAPGADELPDPEPTES